MILSDMVSEVGFELNRSDIDTRIKRWIQQAIDFTYNTIRTQGGNQVATLTATALTETLSLPLNFGELIELRYTPGDSSGYQLYRIPPAEFFRRHADQTTSGFPTDFCIFNNQIYFAVLPESALSYTLTYQEASANIYEHTLNFTDADGAAATGIQIYLDEDAVETGVGKFYFVSPTDTDAIIQVATLDGHVHNITVYDNDDAATDGVAVYFDEDGATVSERLSFVSPTNLNCVVQTGNSRLHSHYVRITDADNAASLGVAVYCDEDAASKTGRFLFVSPTDVDGTSQIVLSKDGIVPPFLERYHEAIYLGALGRGLRFEKQFGESQAILQSVNVALGAMKESENRRGPTVFPAKTFNSSPGNVWDSLKFPEIID